MLNVLYVDDEFGLLEIGKLFLEASGDFTVDTLPSAIPALASIPKRQYDAVISDYQMPGMDGIAFLKAVRSSGNTIPFILFTGRGREEVVIEALNEGADFYLQKGGDPTAQFTELAHKIRRAVDRRKAGDDLRGAYEQIAASEEELRGQYEALAESERRIRESEEKYRRIVETSIEGIWSMDAGFVTTFVNRKMADMLGYTVDEMIGKTITEFMDPGEMADNAEKMTNRRRGHSDFYERKFKRKDGSTGWFAVSATALTKPDGSFAGSFAMLTDITRRKKAEEDLRKKNDELNAAYEQLTASEEELRQNLDELATREREIRESEAKYRALFDNAILGIFRSTPDGHYLDMNPAFARIAGFSSPREMMEKVSDIQQLYVRPQDRVHLKTMLAKEGDIRGFETEIRREDGRRIWIAINVRVYRDETGRILWYDGTIEDITVRKEAQDELRAAHEQLRASEEELRAQYEELARSEQKKREI